MSLSDGSAWEKEYELGKYKKENKTESLTWRNTFCSTHAWYSSVGEARDAAFAAQYPFFTYNNKVYRTGNYEDTGVTTENLNGITEEAF